VAGTNRGRRGRNQQAVHRQSRLKGARLNDRSGCAKGPASRELGPSNIRVNAVSPDAIPTELEHKHYRQGRAAFDQWVIDRQSLPFRSDIRDVADAVLYLLSPLSRFMTGQELHVNGGMYMG
jgi:NAD(P)-dependent dehydrogenase (short-subunit alcohol dehydrogenase family)